MSAANYAAEMLEWAGFALACGLHYPGLVFAAFTVSNLAPRGVAHHRWYLAQFGTSTRSAARPSSPLCIERKFV